MPDLKEEQARSLRACGTDSYIQIGTIRLGILNFISRGDWETFHCNGREWHYTTFETFCDEWLKFPYTKLKKLFFDDEEVLEVLRHAADENPGKTGRPISNDTIMTSSKQGTSKSYTMNRLERDEPQLYAQVMQGELSANAAAEEAGWREKRISMRKNPVAAYMALRKHFTPEELQLIKENI